MFCTTASSPAISCWRSSALAGLMQRMPPGIVAWRAPRISYVRKLPAALKRNISVTPVLLQGAQMPPPERLPEDIRELVYRNGFELGHSTWESDVGEMVRRLGLDKELAVPTPAHNEAEAHPATLAAAGPFKTSWVLATFVVILVIAGVLLYWKPQDPRSGGEIVAPSQQAAGPPSQQSAGSATRLPVGLGAITISNLKTGTVEVYDQSSIAQVRSALGMPGPSLRQPQRYRFLLVRTS